MNKAYIALGTNIEPRIKYLKDAISILEESQMIQIQSKSSIYETPPVGYTDQADFLNMVIELKTSLTSNQLLTLCQQIEGELGRKRVIRNGPRTIDLDILVYNQESKKTDELILPHPRMHQRGFVLIPLNEIAPDLAVPTLKSSVSELLQALPEKEKRDITQWIQTDSEEE
ncbi:2-amino-4-hydroxy-6-hydroxymethyldihydropteridine diphosphokinase [Ornithinibacillus halotolerans]|uniref:2-amino-4-hydroxy-6-hydroxymethyldihydropteridine diphosphokinase n=1 Tax=Ornithinibacillus halotolerans TaxID=1274357 RepID=A0A916W647_9BACI|nr:2-amino-4-hydroxy-6-hydroxymethyldihydropteridine diphosphokinase [Ornithinibacillus halotolerans]GGA71071.1 2-amino-4-hydroxy-6-hydroxymethyldihydropteridine diphosphokinase [Ornithinibacillus halotolerans]